MQFKYLWSFLLLVTLSLTKVEGQCPTSITLSSQADVDAFATNYSDCVNQGWVTSLVIDGSDVADLFPLNVIDSIALNLRIQYTSLTSLNSWTSLDHIEGLNLNYNWNLTDISMLSNISNYNNGLFIGNTALEDFSPVSNAVVTSSLVIFNTKIKSLDGFNNSTQLNYLTIGENDSLSTISGLQNLMQINNNSTIESNSNLTTISGFQNLSEVGGYFYFTGNDAITDLNAFNNLNTVNILVIGRTFLGEVNNNLTTISGFQNLTTINNGLNIGGSSITDVSGFSNLSELQVLNFTDTGLTNLDDLTSLKVISAVFYVWENAILQDISKLRDLAYIGDLQIRDNTTLTDCCIVRELQSNNIVAGSTLIQNNDMGCSSYLDILTSCPDSDNDGILDSTDNCPNDANTLQADTDNDGIGDGCDNCPTQANPQQADSNGNGVGDVCETATTALYGIHNEQGDTYISDPTKGVILTAPDGTCYRIRVNSAGALETYQVICPQ